MVKQFYVGVPSWVRWALVALGLYLFLTIVYLYTPSAVPSWLLPLIGIGALGLLYYRPNWTKATGIGGVVLLLTTLSITSCIAIGPGPNFDPEALDVQGGNLEIVIPAEHYITNAQVSPGGTWLVYTYEYQGDNGRSNIATSLLNIPENKLYDKPLAGWSGAPWLDDNHFSAGSAILRLSDMVVIPKVVVDIESIEEGKALLAGATQLFFVQDSSRFSIQSTDPDYPYTIRFTPYQLGCGDGYDFTPCAEAMLSPDQTYTLTERRDVPNEPVYSPDGQYYVQRGRYPDDPTHSLGGQGDQLFLTDTNELLVYGYRYGWNASFLGWAHDSSGAYILYRPRSAMGDLTRSQYPIRKYLVPGAEPRGLPTVISPAATPRWLPMPNVTPPAPTPIENTSSSSSSASPVVFLLLPFIGMGALGLLYYRPNWTKATEIGGVVLLLTTLSITSCIAIGPSPNFDPEALDVQGGNLEIVIPAEHYILNAQVSPGGTWLAYAYEAQESNGRSSIYTAVSD